MKYIPIVLQSILIIALLHGIVYGVAGFEKPDPTEQTIEVIKECMAKSTASWPDEWKREYVETIHKVIKSHQDITHFDLRLEILRKGFEPYWQSFKKTQDRFLFEVYQARIHWYTEHLMGTKFPTEGERQKLRDQYTDIWNYAAGSLLAQFPFLDPNTVEAAKADDLIVCYCKIETPLMPVYLRPMSDGQVEQIKQRWDNLRYARVDLWRRLGGYSTTPSENGNTPSSNAERDYEFTKENLSQLLGLVWMVVPQRPVYYLIAIENRTEALKRRVQLKRQARSNQQSLEKERSRQLLQTEHISFLLSALLETPLHLDRSASVSTQEQIPSEQQDKSSKGGDAYEIENGPQVK